MYKDPKFGQNCVSLFSEFGRRAAWLELKVREEE